MRRPLTWLAAALGAVAIAALGTAARTHTSPTSLTVHEWGTFTSVFASDGSQLTGLENEAEPLPYFVYGIDSRSGRTQIENPRQAIMKGFARPVKNVTVRMETPVLYFYGDQAFDARVALKFNGGSISQWYPARSGGEVAKAPIIDPLGKVTGGVDFSQPHQGSIEWKVRVEPRTASTDFEIMKQGDTVNWLHPRGPRSNVVRTASGESESYLFYRGLGNFPIPVGFKAENDQIHLTAREDVPWLMILENRGGHGRIHWQGKPQPRSAISLKADDFQPISTLRMQLYPLFHTALTEAGLFPDEADAMLRTWWHSYIDAPGLRAFWIVPREFTDSVLPLEMEPRPDQLQRVLLGRGEILTPAFEALLVEAFAKPAAENPYLNSPYHLAYKARVEQLKK